MSRSPNVALLACAAALALAAPPAASAKPAQGAKKAAPHEPVTVLKLPLAEGVGKAPVARVGDEDVLAEELLSAIARTQMEHGKPTGGHGNFAPVLERMIDTRLIVQEARTMGLDQDPAVAANLDEYRKAALSAALKKKVIATARPDALSVESQYRDAIRAYKVRSLKFAKEEDARAAGARVAGGASYADVAKEAVAQKKATDDGKADVVPLARATPEVAQALIATPAGSCTAPIRVEGGFAILKVEEITRVENAAIKADLVRASLEQQQNQKLRLYFRDLKKKYAVQDDKLLAAIDLEAKKPGFAAFLKDRRPLVKIKGEAPITVADLAGEIRKQFFHGMDAPIRDKKVNEAKYKALEDMVARRVFLKEARAQRLGATESYRLDVSEFENGLIFGRFVDKVIAPDVKVTEGEGRRYYEEHKAEFTSPAFYKLEHLSFTSDKAARAALGKLEAGTDLNFVRANSAGLVPADDSALGAAATSTVSAATLAPEFQKAFQGAKPGDRRVVAFQGQHHLVRLLEVTPPRVQEYPAAREAIAKKLVPEAMTKAVKEYAGKLRAARPVTVYLKQIVN